MLSGKETEKLRILHVTTTLRTGGAEGMLASLVLGMRAHPYTTHVATLLPGGPFVERLAGAGIPVTDLKVNSSGDAPRAVLGLVRLVRRYRPHIVQSWLYHADLLATVALILSGRRSRTRLYWGIRSSNMELGHYNWPLRLSVRTCAKLSYFPDAVIANSKSGRDFHTRIGYHPRRFFVIPNGIDTSRFRPDSSARDRVRKEIEISETSPVIALVARTDPKKDHACFLEAFSQLRGVHALAVGEGTHGLPDMVNLHRLGLRHDVPALLAACDLVVSSSAFGEGFLNAVAEGMACGLPAVVTDVGDARDIVGSTGIIVPPRNPTALTSAIQALLDETLEKRDERSIHVRARIEEGFSIQKAIDAFDTLYRGVPMSSHNIEPSA